MHRYCQFDLYSLMWSSCPALCAVAAVCWPLCLLLLAVLASRGGKGKSLLVFVHSSARVTMRLGLSGGRIRTVITLIEITGFFDELFQLYIHKIEEVQT